MNVMAKMLCVVCLLLCAACDGGDQGSNGGNYATPTNKTLGNGYTIHGFLGENDGISRDNAVKYVNHYFGEAKSYIHGLTNGFDNPEKFQPLIKNLQNTDNYNVNGYDGARNIDAVLNSFIPSETILTQVIENLGGYGNSKKNLAEREAFEMCYSVLANEAFKEGIGSDRNSSNNLMDSYNYTKDNLNTDWSKNEFCKSVDLANAYKQKNFANITKLTNELLEKVSPKMGVTDADLRKVVNIALAGESLSAMHAATRSVLQHNGCYNQFNPTLAMQHKEIELNKADKEQYQNLSLGL